MGSRDSRRIFGLFEPRIGLADHRHDLYDYYDDYWGAVEFVEFVDFINNINNNNNVVGIASSNASL